MKITCPHCNFAREIEPNKVPDRQVKVKCPKCNESFSFSRDSSKSMGNTAEKEHDAMNGNLAKLRQQAQKNLAPQLLLKAGFWVRAVAFIIDIFIILAVQGTLGWLLDFSISSVGFVTDGDPSTSVVFWLFALTLRFGYAVFFVGYCGQTPGKMVLRIKVICTNGSQVSYGIAALREIPGKIISGALLAIGYIMVAFDRQKQGLHDKIADTYVIKI